MPTDNYPDVGVRHEICHVHQHRQAINAGLSPNPEYGFVILDQWLQTPEGIDWVNASNSAINNPGPMGPPFPGQRPLEDNANMCDIWYEESPILGIGHEHINKWPALAEFVNKYWPLTPSHS